MGTAIYSSVIFPRFLIISTFYFCFSVEAPPEFTISPLQKVYVVNGANTKLIWKFRVDNINTDLSLESPAWYFEETNFKRIGFLDATKQRDFQIAPTCPKWLITRLGHEPQATLVINNVTIKDSGVYQCRLDLLPSGNILSTTTLIVTSKYENIS